MAHTIETAKTGRAKCRGCKQAIAKGELRFGEEVVNPFGEGGEMSLQWYHLRCAAKHRSPLLEETLAGHAGEIPERAELEQAILAAKSKKKPGAFPYAERAPSGRSRCLTCEQPIEKGSLRVAVEREVDTGSFVAKSAGYLHPACAPGTLDQADLLAQIKANSTALAPEDLQALIESLGGPGGPA